MPYTESYQRIIDSRNLDDHKKIDHSLGVPIYYVGDCIAVEKTVVSILRETNLNFLKILQNCGFVTRIEPMECRCNLLSTRLVTSIVKGIRQAYRDGTFCDSDLHDDIFDELDIVSPDVADDPIARDAFIESNKQFFVNRFLSNDEQEVDAKKRCNDFLNNRANLFCLYVFLRRCAILYRDTNFKSPFQNLLLFIDDKKNLDSLKEKLRAETVLDSGDCWATGRHEWLCRSFLVDALKRTAGYGALSRDTHLAPICGIWVTQAGKKVKFIWSEFNWLDFQFLIRTPTKHVVYRHNMNAHVGGVYGGFFNQYADRGGLKVDSRTQKTKWVMPEHPDHEVRRGFDANMWLLYESSPEITTLMLSIVNFYERFILHDLTPVPQPSVEMAFFPNGGKTDCLEDIAHYQQTELKKPHRMMLLRLRDLAIQSYIVTSESNSCLTFDYPDKSTLPNFPPSVITSEVLTLPQAIALDSQSGSQKEMVDQGAAVELELLIPTVSFS